MAGSPTTTAATTSTDLEDAPEALAQPAASEEEANPAARGMKLVIDSDMVRGRTRAPLLLLLLPYAFFTLPFS